VQIDHMVVTKTISTSNIFKHGIHTLRQWLLRYIVRPHQLPLLNFFLKLLANYRFLCVPYKSMVARSLWRTSKQLVRKITLVSLCFHQSAINIMVGWKELIELYERSSITLRTVWSRLGQYAMLLMPQSLSMTSIDLIIACMALPQTEYTRLLSKPSNLFQFKACKHEQRSLHIVNEQRSVQHNAEVKQRTTVLKEVYSVSPEYPVSDVMNLYKFMLFIAKKLSLC
jgi:hypothetical protein